MKGNFLMTYFPSDVVLVMDGCLLFAVIVSYPLVCFVVRSSLDHLLFSRSYETKTVNKNYHDQRMWAYSAVLYLATASVGAYVTNVGPVFSLTGASSTMLLSLVLPSAIFLRLTHLGLLQKESKRSIHLFLVICSWVTMILAIIVGVTGFVLEILSNAGVQLA